MPNEEQSEELVAMNALLQAHPQYRTRYLSMAQCLKCRSIDRALKDRYVEIMGRLHPTSNFQFPAY